MKGYVQIAVSELWALLITIILLLAVCGYLLAELNQSRANERALGKQQYLYGKYGRTNEVTK